MFRSDIIAPVMIKKSIKLKTVSYNDILAKVIIKIINQIVQLKFAAHFLPDGAMIIDTSTPTINI